MGAVRRKILEELKDCFRYYMPRHKDILEYINNKYAFKQKPQKGIVLTSAGASPLRLSADNYVGEVVSRVMLAGLENRNALSVEWVREDALAVNNADGEVVSPPGIYYIEVFSKDGLEETLGSVDFQNVLTNVGDFPFYFYVDPLLSVKREPLATYTPGLTTLTVMNAPFLEGSFRLYADGQHLETGTYLTLSSTQSLSVGPVSSSKVDLGLVPGQVRPVAETTLEEPFSITPTTDSLDFTIDGLNVLITLTQGLRTAAQIAQDIRNGLYAAGLPAQDINVTALDNGKVQLVANGTLEFSSDLLSTANPALGFSEGFIPAQLNGFLFPPYAEEDAILPFTVNGVDYELPLYKGHLDPTEIATQMEALVPGNNLTVEAVKGGDYTFDPTTGVVTLLSPLVSGTRLEADYNYPVASSGPFGLKRDTSNNEAIPGVILAFGKQLQNGDKQAVVIHESLVPVADEYGGRWEVSLDMDIITRDPATREEISEMVLMYFFGIRKEALTDEGLEIYDDTAQDYYFNSTVSLSLQCDWAIQVPKPLTIERITPSSYRARAESAGTGSPPAIDLMNPVTPDELNLIKLGKSVYKAGSLKYERIR